MEKTFYKKRMILPNTLSEAVELFDTEENLALFWLSSVTISLKGNQCDYEPIPGFMLEMPIVFMAQKKSPYQRMIDSK